MTKRHTLLWLLALLSISLSTPFNGYHPMRATAAAVSGAESATSRVNVAAAAEGATVSASSSHSSGYAASGANNGDRRGAGWGAGGGWNDATPYAFPDWLRIDFDGTHTIDEIDVFTVQDDYPAPSEPTQTLTFTRYGVTGFDVQYWTGSVWQTVPGGTITGNTAVWRTIYFSPITTSRIRVVVTQSPDDWSRVTEVEAYTTVEAVEPNPVSPSGPALDDRAGRTDAHVHEPDITRDCRLTTLVRRSDRLHLSVGRSRNAFNDDAGNLPIGGEPDGTRGRPQSRSKCCRDCRGRDIHVSDRSCWNSPAHVAEAWGHLVARAVSLCVQWSGSRESAANRGIAGSQGRAHRWRTRHAQRRISVIGDRRQR